MIVIATLGTGST